MKPMGDKHSSGVSVVPSLANAPDTAVSEAWVADSTNSIRRAIVAARVIAIFFMMYVHAWAGNVQMPDEAFHGPFGLFSQLLVDVMGRTAVPLLTIISGYLLVTVSLESKYWPEIVRDKFRTLLVPLWMWNGLLLLLIAGAARLTGKPLPDYVTEPAWYNAVFAFTETPATLPLGFLRDMFVCALLSPILIWLVRHALWPTLFAGFLFAILKPEQAIIIRHQLLLFYMIGLAFALCWNVPFKPTFGISGILSLIIVTSWFLFQDSLFSNVIHFNDSVKQIFANISRICVAWILWNISLFIQSQRGRLYHIFSRTEPAIFIAFCSHFILFRAIGQIVPDDTYLLPLLFLLQPLLAIVVSFGIILGLSPFAPRMLRILNGGRLPRPRG